MSSVPIADYALLSDCRSAALVSRDGSIDWLCYRRFDAPSVFARLLDDAAGHWAIRPVGEYSVRRRYVPDTLVLETTFDTSDGTVVLTDGLAMRHVTDRPGSGEHAPQALVRRVQCIAGEVTLETEFVPRPEYALVRPRLAAVDGGVAARGGATKLLLSSGVCFEIDGRAARACFRLRDGQTAAFALQHRAAWEGNAEPLSQDDAVRHIDATISAWQRWSAEHREYHGGWREMVEHSGRVLRALTFEPTGAVIAAPTTSLAEAIRGGRNWDYRYTWVRDASFTLDALGVRARREEAYQFFEFLSNTALAQVRRGVELQIVFGIGGEHDLSERELDHLEGWRGSRPVRIGNAAWRQRQLDVYGELLDAVHRLGDEDVDRMLDDSVREFLADLADEAANHWQEPDHSVWEIRGAPRNYVYSKLMCWLALDRAVQLAPALRATDRVRQWRETREVIRHAILEHGWSEDAQSFAMTFDGDALDASNLMMAIVGFLPPDDERLRATVRATAERLTDRRGLVYRYLIDDGLPGKEGTFLLCTFWLAHAQAVIGEFDAACRTFEAAVACANDVGLFAEEVDPTTGELLGNFPQAFSHIGLINAARAIATGEHRPKRSGATAEHAVRER